MKRYFEMDAYFLKRSPFRCRLKKGALQDDIYPGVYASELQQHFSPEDIHTAISAKYLHKTMINPVSKNGKAGGYRTVYLWLENPLKQTIWHKRVIAWFHHGYLWLTDKLYSLVWDDQ